MPAADACGLQAINFQHQSAIISLQAKLTFNNIELYDSHYTNPCGFIAAVTSSTVPIVELNNCYLIPTVCPSVWVSAHVHIQANRSQHAAGPPCFRQSPGPCLLFDLASRTPRMVSVSVLALAAAHVYLCISVLQSAITIPAPLRDQPIAWLQQHCTVRVPSMLCCRQVSTGFLKLNPNAEGCVNSGTKTSASGQSYSPYGAPMTAVLAPTGT
jgi:hypothetical protein